MLNLPSTLTQDVAQQCLEALRPQVNEPSERVVVDGTALLRFDTSALAVLLELRRECARRGKLFAVQGLPVRLRELAGLYGISGLLPAA